ncbi:MAG: hypothetical protein ACLR6O_03215 [Eubacterium sp.]
MEIYKIYIYRRFNLGFELAVFWLLQYVIFKLNEVPVTDNQVLSFLGIEYKAICIPISFLRQSAMPPLML